MIVWVQYALLGATALVAVVLTVAQTHLDRSVFTPYLGVTSPAAVMLGVSALAFVSLTYLRSHGSFEIVSGEGLFGGLRFTAVVVPVFALVAITAGRSHGHH